MHILFINDHITLRLMQLDDAEKTGRVSNADEAGNAADAIRLMQLNPPQFIICDFHIPSLVRSNDITKEDEGGIDVCAYARENLPDTPFVFYSTANPRNIIKSLTRRGISFSRDHVFYSITTPIEDVLNFLVENYGADGSKRPGPKPPTPPKLKS